MSIFNEEARAEKENAYELKKIEWKISQQQIIQALQENDNQIDYMNLFRTLEKAIPKIAKSAEGNVDDDKVKRLKDLSKDFSSDEMQEVIAGILAWEYNQSGSFSLKTMDIVKSLSREELNLFRKFCWIVINWEFCFWNFFQLSNENHLKLHKKWISYDDYLYLQELWLFIWSDTAQKMWDNTWNSYDYLFTVANRKIVLQLQKAITFSHQSKLTKAWQELYKLIEPVFDEELFNMCKNELIRQWFEEK